MSIADYTREKTFEQLGYESLVLTSSAEGFNSRLGIALYVDSGHIDAADVDDGEHGLTPHYPLATLAFAYSLIPTTVPDSLYERGIRGYQVLIVLASRHEEDLSTGLGINTNPVLYELAISGSIAERPVREGGLHDDGRKPKLYTTTGAAAILDVSLPSVYIRNIVFESRCPNAGSGHEAIRLGTGGNTIYYPIEVTRCLFITKENTDGWNIGMHISATGAMILGLDISGNSWRAFTDNASCGPAIRMSQTGSVEINSVRVAYNDIVGKWASDGVATALIDDDNDTYIRKVEFRQNSVRSYHSGIKFISFNAATTGILIGNGGFLTGVSPEDAITAAGCHHIENRFTSDLLVASAPTLAPTEAGSLFVVEKSLTHSAIVSGGVDLTGNAAGGDILIEEVIVANGSTAMSSAGGAAVLELYTNNVAGAGSFLAEAEANLAANSALDLESATLRGRQCLLESGKKVTAKATTEDFTSGGTVTVYLICRRVSAGASLAAA